MRLHPFGLACALLAAVAVADDRQPALAGTFGDHMVLQRDAPIRVHGTAAPGVALSVGLAGRDRTVTADATGAWRVDLPAMPAGGPYRLTLRSGSEVVRELEDVMVGDLWLCSGQSNMEFPVAQASGGPHGPDTAEEGIRLLTIQHDSAVAPRTQFGAVAAWTVANRDSVAGFSAVCWFFARELQARYGMPLGLLHASWGGSRIEAWLGEGALRDVGGFEAGLELLRAYAEDERAGSRRFAAGWEAWWRRMRGDDMPWRDAGYRNGWAAVPDGPLRDWKAWGDPAVADHDGMVWFRNSFRLSAKEAGADAVLALGGIDEVDLTWVNGRFVATRFGWGTERRYPIPPGFLQAGDNTVTLNVLSTWGAGGMLGPNERVALEFGDGGRVSLSEGWRYRKVPLDAGMPPRAPWEPISGLSGLHNAMIAPLGEMRMAGALWYQGESNTGDADGYERLLEALIADWRGRFGETLAFIVVQLPNFGTPPLAPVDSGWARIRDAQRLAAAADPLAGLVVTIDTGDDRDLHPPNKTIVGQRAAQVAGALAYGEPGIVDGIGPARAWIQGAGTLVEFLPPGEVLVVAGDRVPVGFELCGQESSSCVYAAAELTDNRVRLSAPGLRDPQRVRYCWADAPICNLYGGSGLPVGSFELPLDHPGRTSVSD
jgi:sialate O-acetylesterase